VSLPPQAQYLPDLAYHETAQSFISRLKQFIYKDESGAIQQSYANVFASLVKQERSGKKNQQADWVLVPGAVAWLKGQDVRTTKDRTPLMSLKEPGTAYNDPVIGKDSQVSHYKDLYKGDQDAGGVHINVGIPNKAFYEAAIRLTSDRAREIWIKALPGLTETANFRSLADQTYQAADTDKERQALKEAWNKVGISVGT
jgi:Zn-dependent metalloprotease